MDHCRDRLSLLGTPRTQCHLDLSHLSPLDTPHTLQRCCPRSNRCRSSAHPPQSLSGTRILVELRTCRGRMNRTCAPLQVPHTELRFACTSTDGHRCKHCCLVRKSRGHPEPGCKSYTRQTHRRCRRGFRSSRSCRQPGTPRRLGRCRCRSIRRHPERTVRPRRVVQL